MKGSSSKLQDEASPSTTWLVGQLAHEIRTPMTSILGFTEMLAADLHGLPGSLAKLDLIRRNGQALLQLTQDVTVLCQLESGTVKPRLETFAAVTLLADVIAICGGSARKKGLLLQAQIDADQPIPEMIRAEQGWLRQVLINLLDNAIKFTSQGHVLLRVSFTDPPESPLGTHAGILKVVIEDTGSGIAEHERERVFEPFFTAGDHRRDRVEQTGLGLAIVRRLVTCAGGTIDLESELDQGSRFTIGFPASAESQVVISTIPADVTSSLFRDTAPEVTRPLRDTRILLADDEPDSQLLLSVVLKNAGAILQLADNGLLAVDLALQAWRQGEPFDIVLMDINMPKLDGCEAVRRLRASGYDRPIVALTAASLIDDRDLCLAVGCDDFFPKPLEPGNLIDRLAAFL